MHQPILTLRGSITRTLSFASIPVASLAMACVLLASGRALAQQSNCSDADGDGLPYSLELLMGTSATTPDSDLDGVSDLEELARHSQPLSASSTPDLTKRLGVGVAVHRQSDGLHGLISVFMADTDLRTKQLKIGFVGTDRYIQLSNAYIATHSTIQYFPSVTQSGCIALIDMRFDENLVHQAGDLSLFARATVPNMPVQIADAAHMLSMAGLVVWSMPAPAPVLQKAGCTSNPSGGSIYVPLLPPPTGGTGGGSGGGGGSVGGGGSGGSGGGGSGGNGTTGVPITWAPGEVCFQRVAPVGTNGATITNEIIAADCLSDWDGFCPPTCSQSVGTTYRTVDPVVLIGG